MADIKKGDWVRVTEGGRFEGMVGLVHLSSEHEATVFRSNGDTVIFRKENLETVTGFKYGDRVRVLLKTGPHGSLEGTVTEVMADGLVSVDLETGEEILFVGFDLEVFDPAPEGTDHVVVSMEGSEDSTDVSGRWTHEEVATIVKLAKALNKNQFFPLQPYMKVTVNGVEVVKWSEHR